MVDPLPELDPLQQAIRWCWAVLRQAERLEVSQAACLTSSRERTSPFGEERRRPFHERYADSFFFVAAANQLGRALAKLDDRSLPAVMPAELQAFRNLWEHWNEWETEKGAAKSYRQQYPGASPWEDRWGAGGTVLGHSLKVNDVVAATRTNYEYLLERERRG